MPKGFLKRWMPNPDKLKQHKSLRLFGNALFHPNLWLLNRRCVPRAFSVGLFCAFVPIPFQMVLSAAMAILVRANVPISIALVWVTNPLTMPPLFYFTYKVGAWILQRPAKPFHFQLSFDWLAQHLSQTWQPFLLGCFVCGVSAAILGNVIIRCLWRWHLIRDWRARRNIK